MTRLARHMARLVDLADAALDRLLLGDTRIPDIEPPCTCAPGVACLMHSRLDRLDGLGRQP